VARARTGIRFVDSYDRAFALEPNDGDLHAWRGVALSREGRRLEARDAFLRAMHLNANVTMRFVQHTACA
jgi:Flp pilus assembly protein TadD